MVKLTILSDDFCQEIGNADADNLGSQLVVNPNKELCGAFVNIINLTLVNYTENHRDDTERKQRWNYSLFSQVDFLFKGRLFKIGFGRKREN